MQLSLIKKGAGVSQHPHPHNLMFTRILDYQTTSLGQSRNPVTSTIEEFTCLNMSSSIFLNSSYWLEKPREFDPRGQSDDDPLKLFIFDPCKVLTDGVFFILPCYFFAFILRMLLPVSSILCDECTILSIRAPQSVTMCGGGANLDFFLCTY